MGSDGKIEMKHHSLRAHFSLTRNVMWTSAEERGAAYGIVESKKES
jgi:hypothetical protein